MKRAAIILGYLSAVLRQQPLTLADIFRGLAEAARAATAPFHALAASIEAANRRSDYALTPAPEKDTP